MIDAQQRADAREFADYWKGKATRKANALGGSYELGAVVWLL